MAAEIQPKAMQRHESHTCSKEKNWVPIHPWWHSPHGHIQYQATSYLGVELSSDLRWNKQVKKTVAKGNLKLGVLKRNLRHCPRSIKDMAYKTILRPKLEYASAVWDPFTEDNI